MSDFKSPAASQAVGSVWLDGEQVVDGSQAILADRGLHYGHGVFETLRVLPNRQGEGVHFCFLPFHLERMTRGLVRLGFCTVDTAGSLRSGDVSYQQAIVDQIRAELGELPLSGAGVLKVVVTAGTAERGYACSENIKPRRFYFWSPTQAPLAERPFTSDALSLMLCEHRLAINPALAGIKHLNRLEQVMAANQVARAGVDDGIMCDQNCNVIETTASNLFLVQDGRLITPDLSHCGISGVLRSAIIKSASLFNLGQTAVNADFPTVSIERVGLEDLWSADEVFITNCVRGVRSIKRFSCDDNKSRTYAVGPITQRVQNWFQAVLQEQRL